MTGSTKDCQLPPVDKEVRCVTAPGHKSSPTEICCKGKRVDFHICLMSHAVGLLTLFLFQLKGPPGRPGPPGPAGPPGEPVSKKIVVEHY